MMDIEDQEYQNFLSIYNNGGYKHLRLGQAFYNHFGLYKLTNQDQLLGIYEKDGHDAISLIKYLFRFV